MAETLSWETLEMHRALLDVLYDSFKVVDPETKRVVELHEQDGVGTQRYCYECWKQREPCENCVAATARQANKAMIKFVSLEGCAYLIRAIPIENTDPPLVVEFLKDVTASLLYDPGGTATDGRCIFEAFNNLNEMVIRDQLTQVYNRRYLDMRLPTELRSTVSKNQPYSVAFVDIDNFKHINDTYGHDVGDLVLQATARALQSCVRGEGDWVARFGGDEFVVCLAGADSAVAHRIAERFREAVNAAEVQAGDEKIHFTVSLGVQTMNCSTCTVAEMLRAADRNMYDAKHGGKDRITLSEI